MPYGSSRGLGLTTDSCIGLSESGPGSGKIMLTKNRTTRTAGSWAGSVHVHVCRVCVFTAVLFHSTVVLRL
jgi:hypothetical protein|eukprot:COSAG01_NODE_6671_length_3553_cov_23.353214_2_plen_71_part_00